MIFLPGRVHVPMIPWYMFFCSICPPEGSPLECLESPWEFKNVLPKTLLFHLLF